MLINLENDSRKFIQSKGRFHVLEYEKDISVAPWNSEMEYFMGKMGVRRRQLVIEMDNSEKVIIQAGAMQWSYGSIKSTTGIKGAGDLLKKAMKGAVVNESVILPEYEGEGILALEPAYKFIILEDVSTWPGGMTVEDGMFLACEGSVNNRVVGRKTISSAALGKEGLFNISLFGDGIVALESNVPQNELIEIELNGDELRIDGDLAVCWSSDLQFTVERSMTTLTGSFFSKEGLVNVYRGYGKVLMSPVAPTDSLYAATNTMKSKAAAPNSNTMK